LHRLPRPHFPSVLLLCFVLLVLAVAPPLFSQAAQQPTQAPPAKGASPSLNETWKSEKIEPLVERLEAESREIYRERARLATLVAPKPGSAIADIGAGSGFMVEEFAKLVGPKGKVYAVDINAKMMEHVAERAKTLGLANIETVVTREDSVDLPPNSVDMVFVCDTYHHFEYPEKSLRGIYEALRPGGELIIVDFHLIPGKTAPFLLEHVRGTKAEFTKEIIAARFALVGEHAAEFLNENYVLRFRKTTTLSPDAGRDGIEYASCLYCPAATLSEDGAKQLPRGEGILLLRVLISAEGLPTEFKVVRTPGWALADDAMASIKRWRFKPSRDRNGQAIAAWNSVEVVFRLSRSR